MNVPDLKCCRLVNRKFNQMVMDETKFKDQVIMKVKKKRLTLQEFGKTEENWKKVSLTFPAENALNPSNCEWLYPLLKEVEFLSLRLDGRMTTTSTTDLHPLFDRLLSSSRKLKSLALEPEFIQLGSDRMTADGMETLEKLEHLEILQSDCKHSRPFPSCEYRKIMRKAIPDFCQRLRNVKVYRSYLTPADSGRSMFENLTFGSGSLVEAIFLYSLHENIMKNNWQHLQSYPFRETNRSMGANGIIFWSDIIYDTPALITLAVDRSNLAEVTHIFQFISCLNSRPRLEQLEISCAFYNPENNTVLLNLISSVARHGDNLKKLKLQLGLENVSDWKFLSLSNLRDLRMVDCRMGEQKNEWIRQVMANVPKSIEKLYLRGALLRTVPKKSVVGPLKTEYFARLDPQLVTQLSIFSAGGLVDNQVAQFICQNFKMLRKLNLSDTQTDDKGFSEIGGLRGNTCLEICDPSV